MIRRLLCWIGWHEWVVKDCCFCQNLEKCAWGTIIGKRCPYEPLKCKHCGKVKR